MPGARETNQLSSFDPDVRHWFSGMALLKTLGLVARSAFHVTPIVFWGERSPFQPRELGRGNLKILHHDQHGGGGAGNADSLR